MSKKVVNTIILSDLHIGSSLENLDSIEYILDNYVSPTWILNGDIFDFWKMFHYPDSDKSKTIGKQHLSVISKLIEISNYSDVMYITGNHDDLIRFFVPFKLGEILFTNKYEFLDLNNKKCCVIHGDTFDVFSSKLDYVAKVSDFIFHSAIHNRYGKSITDFIIDKAKCFVSKINNFNNKAISYAIQNNYDIIICGHTHIPEFDYAANKTYINSGDFVDSNSFIVQESTGEWLIESVIRQNRGLTIRPLQRMKVLQED
jgi:UDP-2,3-diacylglucosamine pyrophosphatase LpxH